MRPQTFGLALTVAALLMAFTTTTALAAPPSNDAFADRTVIGALPFTDVIDTTEATADPTDPIGCGGPSLETVWYEFTPATDMQVVASTEGSDYLAGTNVFVGDPSDPANLELVNCGLPVVGFFASAGTTYFLMVTPAGPGIGGGTLVFNVFEAPPLPELELEIDPVGSVDPRIGQAVISGTLDCSEPIMAFVNISLRQRLGRMFIQGEGLIEIFCDGPTPFEVTVEGFNGLFTGGMAEASGFAFACTPFACTSTEASADVRLTGRP